MQVSKNSIFAHRYIHANQIAVFLLW